MNQTPTGPSNLTPISHCQIPMLILKLHFSILMQVYKTLALLIMHCRCLLSNKLKNSCKRVWRLFKYSMVGHAELCWAWDRKGSSRWAKTAGVKAESMTAMHSHRHHRPPCLELGLQVSWSPMITWQCPRTHWFWVINQSGHGRSRTAIACVALCHQRPGQSSKGKDVQKWTVINHSYKRQHGLGEYRSWPHKVNRPRYMQCNNL